MKRFICIFLCICILMTIPLCAFAEETTESTAPDKSEYEDGVLGWLEGIFDGFASLPSRIWDSLKAGFDSIVDAIDSMTFPDIMGLFDGFDFTPVTDFFTNIWEQLKTGFGLKDFIVEHFGWLSDESPADDSSDESFTQGLRDVWLAFSKITDALPDEVGQVLIFCFCVPLIVALLAAF